MNAKSDSSHPSVESADSNIRLAGAADIAAIIALERNSPQAAHWSEQIYREMFAGEAAPRIAIVAEENGMIAGFIVARVAEKDCELENIAVAENVQRRGTGSKLMRALISEARKRNAARIFLEVRESNRAARALYEKCGFGVTGDRKSYYATENGRENAVLYTLAL
jgi:ribosomal-protein-alanine acetyltransferase